MQQRVSREKTLIGRTAEARFPSEGVRVPVKIDTGADSSSIWASELHIDDAYELSFVLFAKGSPYYTGYRHTTKAYKARQVRSSNGTVQIRYQVQLTVILSGRKVRGSFTLADRSSNTYPVLVGCRLLTGKFLVDVAKGKKKRDAEKAQSQSLNKELHSNPKAFFEKYHQTNQRGDIQL